VLRLADASAAQVQLAEFSDGLGLARLEGSRHFEDLLLEGIQEELVVLVLQRLYHCALLVQDPEQLVVRPDQGGPDECPADGTGYWLVGVVFEHALEAVVTEEVLVGAGQHRPPAQDVVGFEADVADGRRTALPLLQPRQLLSCLLLLPCLVLVP